APSRLYTLSLHDALPISVGLGRQVERAFLATAVKRGGRHQHEQREKQALGHDRLPAKERHYSGCGRCVEGPAPSVASPLRVAARSEEHTSELQSRENLVC